MSERPRPNRKPNICCISLGNFAALIDHPEFGPLHVPILQRPFPGVSFECEFGICGTAYPMTYFTKRNENTCSEAMRSHGFGF